MFKLIIDILNYQYCCYSQLRFMHFFGRSSKPNASNEDRLSHRVVLHFLSTFHRG